MKLLDRLVTHFVHLTIRFPKITLLIALAITVVSAYLTHEIQIRTNFSDLLPDDHPSVIQAKELEQVVGGASFIVVAVETQNAEAASDFLSDLKSKLLDQNQGDIRYIDDEPPANFLRSSSLLFLNPKELNQLKESIRQRIEQAKLQKAGLYIDFSDDTLFSSETEDLKEKYGTYLNPSAHYQNNDGTLFASLIKPDWRATDVGRTQNFVERTNKIITDLNPQKYDPSLNVRLTGPYIKQMTQKRILLKDATLVSAVSFIGSILYLIFHFRRKRAVFLIGVPLFVSSIWALGAAFLLFGSLNLFSSAVCAILLGLAADYGIHFYSEYRRHRNLGENPEEALELSISHLGRAFVAASSTTAAAFFSLGFTKFKALHEFGIIAGLGIFLCGLAFMTLFPALTLLIERRWPEKVRDLEEPFEDTRSSRFIAHLANSVLTPKCLIVSSLLLLLPVFFIFTGHLKFDYNLNHILGRQETKELDQRIDAIFTHSVNPEVALASNLEDADKVAHAIRAVQSKNEKSPQGSTLKGAVSLNDFVPDHQEEKLAKIREIRGLFTPSVVNRMSEKDRKSYEDLKPLLEPKTISLQDVPQSIKNKFMDREGSVGRMVFVFPNFEFTQGDRFVRFVEEIREVQCPDCDQPFYASGESTVFYEIVKLLFRDGRIVVGFTVLMILAALWLNFKNLSSVATVFAPLVVGLLSTMGWMAILRMPFNIINLAAIPIILGTADDYGVHFFQRYVDHPEASLTESYRLTFSPILGSALTTIIGFASLDLADMGGIRSFGLVCTLGIFLCTITTLVWFPGLLAMLKRRASRLGQEDLAVSPRSGL